MVQHQDWEVRGEAKPEIVQALMEGTTEELCDQVDKFIQSVVKPDEDGSMLRVVATLGAVIATTIMSIDGPGNTNEMKMDIACSSAAFILSMLTAHMQKEIEDGQSGKTN